MRILCGVWLAAALCAGQSGKTRKDVLQGIKTPGVQIPFASLKADAELPLAPRWMIFSDAILLPNKAGGLERLDAKTNKLVGPVAGPRNLCGGAATGFASLWISDCAAHSLVRLDEKAAADPKAPARGPKLADPVSIATGVGSAVPSVAATADSVWILSDDKTTLSRIDPDQNKVVSELRLPAGCNSLTFGETALWVTCPSENLVLRVNPVTTLIEKRIEVPAQPSALVIGESSLWVLCLKEGKIERIDPKDEKVVQQFRGAAGGAIFFGQNSVWLTNVREGTLWRIDPKRIVATLAE